MDSSFQVPRAEANRAAHQGARAAPAPCFRQENQRGAKHGGVLSPAGAPGFKGSLWAERSPCTSQMENPFQEKWMFFLLLE